MHSPAAALTWELWHRHSPRLLAIVGLFLGFALVYPLLCAASGFNPASEDPLGEIARILSEPGMEGFTMLRFFEILLCLFLVCSPWLAMIASLLCVTWMFTLIELDPKTKTLTFPSRLFTLPISTPFLAWSLMLSGMATMVVLHSGWIYFVRLPHVEMFETYQSGLGWLTLLALAQGLVWALDGWPTTRMVLVVAVFFCFLFSPTQRHIFQYPWLLPALFFLGVVLARAGMQQVRHGQWQTWATPLQEMTRRPGAGIKDARRFGSPARAQLWFEWRSLARSMCFYAAGLTLVPVAILLVLRGWFGRPLQDNDLSAITCYLLGVPLFVHFAFAISPSKTDLPFLLNRPLTNGELMMPKLKAAAISTVIAWGLVLAALCALPWLGNFLGVLHSFPPAGWAVLGIGLIFLTWRFIPVSLGFAWSGNRRLAEMPLWIILLIGLPGGMILSAWAQDEAVWNTCCRLFPWLLAGLVALKGLLAFAAFRLAHERRLLSRPELTGYLLVWGVIVAVLLVMLGVMAWVIPPPDRGTMLCWALGIVLLVPLARVGFAPIALAWNRHA